MMRIHISFRAAPDSGWPTKLLAVLAGLFGLAAVLLVMLGVWFALAMVVIPITGYCLVRAWLSRDGSICGRLEKTSQSRGVHRIDQPSSRDNALTRFK